MLPIVDKPVIQYIVEEAVAAGITQVIFVTAIGKRAIEDHFDRSFELEARLMQRAKRDILARVTAIGKLASFAFVRQDQPLGDGHALLAALPFVDAHEPVAVLFGDDVLLGDEPGIGQLIATHAETGGSVIAVVPVPKRETARYGIVAGTRIAERTTAIRTFVEKPDPDRAPSRLAFIGRAVLTPSLLAFLRRVAPGKDGEIRLADALIAALAAGEPVYAREVVGDRYDCGNPLGFLEANVALGLAHPEYGRAFRRFLTGLTS